MHPKTIRNLDAMPGEMVKLSTRRGTIEIMVRADRGISEDMVFLPFAYVEAAANILTNSALDPYGKIPEFKFCAVKVEKVEDKIAAE
jgi:formate dehydrogenase major subunit